MKRFYLLLIICHGLSFSNQAQEPLTLDEAVSIGLEKNFSIKLARSDETIDANNHTYGNAGFMPVISLSARQNYIRQNVDLEILGSGGSFQVQRNWAKSDQLNSSLGLNWIFFDGGEMFHSYNRLGEVRDAGAISTRINLENTMALISEAFYRIVLEQARLKVLEDNLAISEERKRFAQSRYEVGKSSKLDFLAAQVDYNADKTALLVQEEILKNAKVDLNFLMGVPVDEEFLVQPQITINNQLDYNQLIQSYESTNPDLLLAMKKASIAYYETRELQSRKYPLLNFEVAYNYSNSANEAGQLRAAQIDGVNYAVGANWLLFDGSNRRREVQNARISEEISQVTIEELRLSIQADLQKTINRYSKSVVLVDLELQNLEVAKENESITFDRYQLGVSSALELREAQRNAVDAESRLLDAQFSTKSAEIELLRLSGNIVTLISS